MSARETSPGPPRWLLVLLAAGLSLLTAAILVLLLAAAGVDRISDVLFVGVLVASALVGGWSVRLLAPRLPPIRRRPRG